jgi:aminoglycoside phosphotransferase (APT) family kinase protein
VCRTGLFAPGVLDAYTEHLARIREIYVWDSEKSVSSHNDPLPNNILFDGERLWMIDWESAYRNDPLVDVAIVEFAGCEGSRSRTSPRGGIIT